MAQEQGSIKDRAQAVVHEGNVRRVVVSKDGRTYVDLSLTLVIVACVLAPWLAALGLVVAVIKGAKIEVIRPEEIVVAPPTEEPPAQGEAPAPPEEAPPAAD